jgi:hypothetical protein
MKSSRRVDEEEPGVGNNVRRLSLPPRPLTLEVVCREIQDVHDRLDDIANVLLAFLEPPLDNETLEALLYSALVDLDDACDVVEGIMEGRPLASRRTSRSGRWGRRAR